MSSQRFLYYVAAVQLVHEELLLLFCVWAGPGGIDDKEA